MEVQAVAKFVKRTPRKARLVADSVKGLRVGEALAFLEFSPKHAATDVAKVIKSAAANAEHNFNLNREELVVKQLLIDEGPTMKRLRFRSRGMASQYFRRTCHITAVVEDQPVVVRPARPARPKPAARKPAAKAPSKPAAKAAQTAKAEEAPAATEEDA
ncbi:MAG TPA: 50S ribosomal protein L22 [Candidatus Dormibacteraeota bacterium]|nr:50S ribosomal protein L22 [Candidatus Dormibacteraeota bacterium]